MIMMRSSLFRHGINSHMQVKYALLSSRAFTLKSYNVATFLVVSFCIEGQSQIRVPSQLHSVFLSSIIVPNSIFFVVRLLTNLPVMKLCGR